MLNLIKKMSFELRLFVTFKIMTIYDKTQLIVETIYGEDNLALNTPGIVGVWDGFAPWAFVPYDLAPHSSEVKGKFGIEIFVNSKGNVVSSGLSTPYFKCKVEHKDQNVSISDCAVKIILANKLKGKSNEK